MKLLVVGSGGREHALAWSLSQSKLVEATYVAPGNDGMPAEWIRIPYRDYSELLAKVKESGIDFVVIGPDQALADGLVDMLEEAGVACFGPTKAAAKLEWSKAFAKEVMIAAQVPTAKYSVASGVEQALKMVRDKDFWSGSTPGLSQGGSAGGVVVKADGLALGKGVKVCPTIEEAENACRELGAGIPDARFVLEQRLLGKELSCLAVCDGETAVLLPEARDFKRIFEGDRGPNTGGMGAYSPVEGVDEKFLLGIREQVFLPVLKEMKKRGTPFKGVLYAGLMVSEWGATPKYGVLEFNARFGDPETQAILPRLSDDLLPVLIAASKGGLGKMTPPLPARLSVKSEQSVYVVCAAKGYPDAPQKGDAIEISGKPFIFYAGVKRNGSGKLETQGGRVLGVLGLGKTQDLALETAYKGVEEVSFSEKYFRRDIGSKPRVAIMASGEGTGFEALVTSVKDGTVRATLTALLCDKENARVVSRARENNVPVRFIKTAQDIKDAVQSEGITHLILAGYMKILEPSLIEWMRDQSGLSRVINIHPSLLPAFKGLNAYGQAFEYGCKIAGVTVHLVEAEVDSGPILAQATFSIEGAKSAQEVEQGGKVIEHALYPATLRWFLSHRYNVSHTAKGRTHVCPN